MRTLQTSSWPASLGPATGIRRLGCLHGVGSHTGMCGHMPMQCMYGHVNLYMCMGMCTRVLSGTHYVWTCGCTCICMEADTCLCTHTDICRCVVARVYGQVWIHPWARHMYMWLLNMYVSGVLYPCCSSPVCSRVCVFPCGSGCVAEGYGKAPLILGPGKGWLCR